jgi:SAM-dependent methyltransferase
VAHPAQQAFVAEVAAMFPQHFNRAKVLEVGSLNINGTVRDHFRECDYLGIDVVPGPGVDHVCAAHELRAGSFDTIVSCETLEHDKYWLVTLPAMVLCLRPGGLLVITCAGPARAEHGTRRTSPQDSGTTRIEGWADYYRNLDEQDLRRGLPVEDCFARYEFRSARAGQDTQFWGLKKEK